MQPLASGSVPLGVFDDRLEGLNLSELPPKPSPTNTQAASVLRFTVLRRRMMHGTYDGKGNR